MFNKKYFAVLMTLTLIFTLSAAVMAHGGAHGGTNNNGNNNNQNFSHGPGMMGTNGSGYGSGMMSSGFNNEWNSIGHQYNNMMGAMMGHGMMGFNNYGDQNDRFGMMNNYNQFMNDYGPGVNNRNYNPNNTNMEREELIELSQELLKERYGDQFQIVDMIAYSNSPYYLVVREENKKEAAFALMFDPVRRVVYPEYGPNMMWNRNYGMAFMMGWNDRTNRSQIDREQALENARDFASSNGLRVKDNGYQFSGYYSFYVENNNQPVGLVSVNAYSGEVWAHNWNGNLIEIIEVRN
ncbi:hypothetical protein C7954_1589 [Halanaerobium congolense]|uniref:Peptidase propeptide and YPEB domain-containing protein n=1 Tax=Halanaerobium congolense TaxID=54121 RepID=A0A4R8G6V8_9FIRM|nr:hypothetical protein [Halanaerobium congolense]TDX35502.1 hypothetical protein C7954_1589 [Halanaerobium congolense]